MSCLVEVCVLGVLFQLKIYWNKHVLLFPPLGLTSLKVHL